MALLAGFIILYNLVISKQNFRMIQEHPFLTLFSHGQNLKPGYTFRPPYTGFEILIMAAGLTGLGLVALWLYRRKREDEKQ